MTIYQLKPAFQKLLRPTCKALWSAGVTPNQVTIGAVVLSLITGGVLIWRSSQPGVLLLLAPVLLVRMALNAIDGMLANQYGQKSRLGAILNELGDVISDTAIYLPLALGWGFSPVLVTLVVVAAIISEMAGLLGLLVGADRRNDGPMGKSDRAFLFGAAGVLIGFGAPLGLWQHALLLFMLVLLAITIWNRARMALISR